MLLSTFATKPIDMRNLCSIALVLLAVSLLSCNNSNSKTLSGDVVYNPNTADGKVDPSKLPEITFENDTHDFGTIASGDMVRYSFKFKNTGKSLLVISDVTTSCGCTVSSFPKEPINRAKAELLILVSTVMDEEECSVNRQLFSAIPNHQPNNCISKQ